jgi:hypothetical protein
VERVLGSASPRTGNSSNLALEAVKCLKRGTSRVDSRSMDRALSHRRFLAAVVASLLVVGLLALWVSARIGGMRATLWIDDCITPLAAFLGCAGCLRAARGQSGRMRTFWLLFAAAMASWTLAEIIWGYYALVLNVAVPVPSWADVGYLGAIPLAVAALVLHPALHASGRRRARSLLEGLLLATALLFISWTLGLHSLWQSTDLTKWSGVVAVAYPFGDIVIAFFIVLAIRGMTAGDRVSLWWLLGALLAMAVSDSTFTYMTAAGTYNSPGLLDTGWVVAYLGVGLAGLAAQPADAAVPTRADERPSLASLVAPVIPVLIALTVAAIEIKLGHHLDQTAWVMAFVLVVLVLVRQALAVFEFLAPSRSASGLMDRLTDVALGGAPYSDTPAAGHAAASNEWI